MTDEFDPWAWESGLTDNATGPVAKAWFAPDPQMGPNYLLHLEIEDPNLAEGSTIEKYGIGPDWRSFDGGQTVEHPKGAEKRFNQNSQVAKLGGQFMEIGAPMRQQGDPRRAATFVGLNCRWERTEIGKNFNDPTKAVTRLWPVEFLGLADGSPGQVSQSGDAHNTGAPSDAEIAARAQAATQGQPTNGQTPLDPALTGMPYKDQIKMQMMAKQFGHSDWVDQVMDAVPSSLEHPEVVSAFADESGLYARLRG